MQGQRVSSRVARPLFGLLFGVLVLLTFVWVVPGPFSIDEATYHRMMHDLVAGHGFMIWNGYEELHSPELTSMFIRATEDGHLAAQYPYGVAVLAAPFNLLFGARGAFVLNVLAYVVSVALCFRISLRLQNDLLTALIAAALLVSTYYTEYALASWPHASAVAAILGAATLALESHLETRARRSLKLAFAAGVVLGLGATLRLDVLLCLPAVAAPFFFSSPTRIRQLLAIGVGCIPGGTFIVWSNFERWGGLSPLTYGPRSQMWDFRVFAAATVVLVGAAWLLARPRSRAWTVRNARPVIVVALAALVLLLFAVPALQQRVSAVAHGTVSLFFDLRVLPSPGVEFLDSRAVTFGDEYKKALLQSCPFVALAVLSVIYGIGRGGNRFTALWSSIVPATLLIFFGAFAWHGGISLNLRYLLPALPFLAVLSADAARKLAAVSAGRHLGWTVAGAFVLTIIARRSLAAVPALREEVLLSAPVLLAFALIIAAHVAVRWRSARCAILALSLLGSSVAWSIDTTVDDAMWGHERRARHREVSATIGPMLPAGSLLFAEFADPFYGVIDYADRVMIAIPYMDEYRDMPDLVQRQLQRGGRVFGAFRPATWDSLRNRGALAGFTTQIIQHAGPYVLAELEPLQTASPPSP